MSVKKPTLTQLNPCLQPEYLFGGWGKDSKPVRGHGSMYLYSAYISPSVHEIYLGSNYEKFTQTSSFTHHPLPIGYEATTNKCVVHCNTVYYQASIPFKMTKSNLTSSLFSHWKITKQASQSYSYTYLPNQYLDFSADEKGLWVIYATEKSKGKIVVTKIDEKSFAIEDERTTQAFMPQVGCVGLCMPPGKGI